MIAIGLTGTLASGKSTVAGLFEAWGAARISADELSREVVKPGSDASAHTSIAPTTNELRDNILFP